MIQMECTCTQKYHSIPTETIEISEHALEKIPQILSGYHRIFMVADENTYAVAGKRVEASLRTAGMLSHVLVLPAGALPNAESIGRVLIDAGKEPDPYDINAYSLNPDYILAVGSGAINDICRMVSYRLHIPYGVAGTAPSMDGYASVVCPLLNEGKKIVYTCSIARHIIIDIDVNAQAPYPLFLAGLGDMLGKYIAILDWEMAHEHIGEYFCSQIADKVIKAADQCIAVFDGMAKKTTNAVRSISEGLLLSGKCMAFTGTSRPASGMEHMIAQTWEVMDIEEGINRHLHGNEVGEATFASIELYRKLYRETEDESLRALIAKYLPAFDKIEELQRMIKLPFTVVEQNRFVNGILRGRTFRQRYTLLQYLFDRNRLEEYAQEAYHSVMDRWFFGSFEEQFPDWPASQR